MKIYLQVLLLNVLITSAFFMACAQVPTVWNSAKLEAFYHKQERALDVAAHRNPALANKNYKLKRGLVERLKKIKQELEVWGGSRSGLPLRQYTDNKLGILLSGLNITTDELPAIFSGFAQDDCHRVSILILGKNCITRIPENFFDNFTELTYLDLSDNKLQTLPKNISKLQKLTELNLAKNEFSQPPEDIFAGLTGLQKLYLYDNKLTKTPNSVCELINLTVLNLSGNNDLKSLPEGLSTLKNLKKLTLPEKFQSDQQVVVLQKRLVDIKFR